MPLQTDNNIHLVSSLFCISLHYCLVIICVRTRTPRMCSVLNRYHGVWSTPLPTLLSLRPPTLKDILSQTCYFVRFSHGYVCKDDTRLRDNLCCDFITWYKCFNKRLLVFTPHLSLVTAQNSWQILLKDHYVEKCCTYQ